jgi:hypothetical protein
VSETTPVPPQPEPQARGFLANLFDLYVAPREAFTSILKKPGFVVAMVLVMAIGVTFSAIWVQHMDAREFGKLQLQESGQWERMSETEREQALGIQEKVIPAMVVAMGLLGPAAAILVVAAVLLLVFRVVLASSIAFKQSATITAFSFLAVSLIQTPLMLLTLFLKGDWNIDPNQALAANLTLLLDKAETAKALYSLAGSIDLFSFWTIFLLAVGFGVATKRPTGSAIWGILLPWGLYVVIKVGLAAVF